MDEWRMKVLDVVEVFDTLSPEEYKDLLILLDINEQLRKTELAHRICQDENVALRENVLFIASRRYKTTIYPKLKDLLTPQAPQGRRNPTSPAPREEDFAGYWAKQNAGDYATLDKNRPYREVLARLEHALIVIVIENSGKMLGIVTNTDLQHFTGNKLEAFAKDVMQQKVVWKRPDTPMEDIEQLFMDQPYDAIPIIEDTNEILGVVTRNEVNQWRYLK